MDEAFWLWYSPAGQCCEGRGGQGRSGGSVDEGGERSSVVRRETTYRARGGGGRRLGPGGALQARGTRDLRALARVARRAEHGVLLRHVVPGWRRTSVVIKEG